MAKPGIPAQRVIKICPAVEELEGASDCYCPEATCGGVKFKNSSNLEMHLVKHHNFPPSSKDPTATREFYCPIPDCPYNLQSGKEASFSSRKYLKQHFQKVHADKVFECLACGKKYATVALRESHEKTCGDYECPDCHYTYKSRESLLSHVRRKHNGNVSTSGLKRKRTKGIGKTVPDKKSPTTRETIEIGIQTNSRVPVATVEFAVEMATQYEQVAAQSSSGRGDSLIAAQSQYCQTIDANGYFEDSFSCFNAANSNGPTQSGGAVSSIETQTDLLEDFIQNSDTLMSAMYSNDRHTQTCDEILSELLVNDIETQTNLFEGINNSIQTQTIDDDVLGATASTSTTHTQT